MKKQLFTAIIALFVFSANAQWIQQYVPYGYEGYMNDIRITDANTVWGVPLDPALHTTSYTKNFCRTIDGGSTWTFGTVSAPAKYVISNIWPIDADTCYVTMFDSTAAGGVEYKTTDGGASWAQVGANMFQGASSFADVTYFWDAQNGMAMGDPIGAPLKYEIWLTNDYGNTWTQVPPASLPVLANTAEYGITNLFDAREGRVWFGTTYGDVYRSIDGGATWTKSATGFPPYTGTTGARQDISNISFSDSLNGLITQVNATTTLLKSTNDGGLTWTSVTASGPLYSGDMTAVPGKFNTYVSAGSSNTGGFGTSYSDDGGTSWFAIDTNVSHTAVAFLDSVTGWTGEYIAAGATGGGAYKFDGVLAAVPCNSPLINYGISTANDSSICFNDTLTVTTVDVQAPTEGVTHGFSIIVSTADISGNNDPLNDPSFMGGTGIIVGTPPPTILINDQAIFPPGMYYFTPVVYGNATGTDLNTLVLDPNCTFTGTSVYVDLLDIGDPQCTVGISDFSLAQFAVTAYSVSSDVINVHIRALKSDDKSSIEIYDMTGRKVFGNHYSISNGINDVAINVADLSTGTYIIRTQSAGSVATTKLVKM